MRKPIENHRSVIYAGFFGLEFQHIFEQVGFMMVEHNINIGRSQKVRGNYFKNYALKLIIIWKITEKIREENQNFPKIN